MAPAGTRKRPRSGAPARAKRTKSTGKALTIGAVCKILSREFDDVSISKIRYLEDRKLLTPRRTPGGYRLYSQADVERLQTILRLQRDEFLPLRVIRQELEAGRSAGGGGNGARRGARVLDTDAERLGREQLIEIAGADQELVAELEEYGLLEPEPGDQPYDESDVELVRSAAELARFGIAARNLRVFRSSAERESGLIEQVLGAGLSARNPQRRKEAIENLESLAAICTRLTQLLLVRRLRDFAQRD